MDIPKNITDIIIAILVLFVTGIVIKFVYNKISNRVSQKNIHIEGGGDVVGRDKINDDDRKS